MEITAYKGTDKDMKCRGYQYEIGKEYEHDGKVETCGEGFHACEYPLDVLSYYDPANSRFFEVEQSGIIDKGNDKTASSKLKINAEIGIVGLVKKAIEYTWSKIEANKRESGYQSAASNTGDYSAASNTGDKSVASNTGYKSAASNIGKESIAIAWGYQSKAMITEESSCMVICDWRENENGYYIHKKYFLEVGDKLQRKTIKPNVWYWFEDGKLKN